MKTYIYILIDPQINQIKYVGKSNNPADRYKNHKNDARDRNTHKRNWIKSLRKQGVKPEIEIVDEVEIEDWKYWERFWIFYYRALGCKLTNYLSGGDGLTFGNRTSFKKGNKPWNTGTAKPKILKGRNPKSDKTTFKKGTVPWNKNKTNYKLSGEKESKSVIQYTLDNIFIKEHLGCKEASIEMKCIPENIRRCCVGKNKTAKNFIWRYKT